MAKAARRLRRAVAFCSAALGRAAPASGGVPTATSRFASTVAEALNCTFLQAGAISPSTAWVPGHRGRAPCRGARPPSARAPPAGMADPIGSSKTGQTTLFTGAITLERASSTAASVGGTAGSSPNDAPCSPRFQREGSPVGRRGGAGGGMPCANGGNRWARQYPDEQRPGSRLRPRGAPALGYGVSPTVSDEDVFSAFEAGHRAGPGIRSGYSTHRFDPPFRSGGAMPPGADTAAHTSDRNRRPTRPRTEIRDHLRSTWRDNTGRSRETPPPPPGRRLVPSPG
jgi:hypothetical protein